MTQQQGGGAEQRSTFRLLSYWNGAKGGRAFPALSDIQITQISELWHFTFTMALGVRAEEHVFSYFGPELATIFGHNYTGDEVETAMGENPLLLNTIGFYPKVLDTRTPISDSTSFMLERREVRHRSLIVPLSSDGQRIDYLMGTTNFKMF